MTFEILNQSKAIEEADAIKDEKLLIDVVKYKEKKSLNANSYFWVLADKIAKAVKSDKWTIYLMLLCKYGVFVDVCVIPEAVEDMKAHLQRDFRYIEVIEEGEMSIVRCYYGFHTYSKDEANALIQATVEEAKLLGIETLTPNEIAEMMAHFEKEKE